MNLLSILTSDSKGPKMLPWTKQLNFTRIFFFFFSIFLQVHDLSGTFFSFNHIFLQLLVLVLSSCFFPSKAYYGNSLTVPQSWVHYISIYLNELNNNTASWVCIRKLKKTTHKGKKGLKDKCVWLTSGLGDKTVKKCFFIIFDLYELV